MQKKKRIVLYIFILLTIFIVLIGYHMINYLKYEPSANVDNTFSRNSNYEMVDLKYIGKITENDISKYYTDLSDPFAGYNYYLSEGLVWWKDSNTYIKGDSDDIEPWLSEFLEKYLRKNRTEQICYVVSWGKPLDSVACLKGTGPKKLAYPIFKDPKTKAEVYVYEVPKDDFMVDTTEHMDGGRVLLKYDNNYGYVGIEPRSHIFSEELSETWKDYKGLEWSYN